MPSAREQYLQAMASLTEMTRTRAERLASRLAKQGELQSGQVGRFAEDLVRRTQRNRETMSRLVQREVKRQLSVLGIATRDEVSRLQQRVRALEQAVERPAAAGRRSGGTTGSRSGGSRTAGSTGGSSRTAASGGSTSSRSARSGGAASSGGGRSSGGTSTRSGGTGSGRAGGASSRTTRRSSSKSGPEESGSE